MRGLIRRAPNANRWADDPPEVVMETKLKVRVIGYYTLNIADPKDCKRCHNANYGDVMVEDICGQCLLEVYNAAQQSVQSDKCPDCDGKGWFGAQFCEGEECPTC